MKNFSNLKKNFNKELQNFQQRSIKNKSLIIVIIINNKIKVQNFQNNFNRKFLKIFKQLLNSAWNQNSRIL